MEANIWYRLRVLTIDPRGKRVPLEFAAASTTTTKKCHVHLAATDGVWLRNGTPHRMEQHNFDPTGAGRMEFAILCPERGQFPILVHSMQLATLHVVDGSRSNSLASPFIVEADEQQQQQLRSWKPTFPSYLQDLSSIDDDDGNATIFEHHTMISVNRTINGHSWDPQTPLLSIDYDSYQEWHLIGTATHPFHIHVFHVQTFNCPPHVDGQYYDTVMSTSDDCRVRFHVTDFSQRIVVHCHNVVHEDQGMMVWFNVTNGGPVQDTAYREELVCQSVPR